MREPRPDWSPLGVNFKILDEHPYLFYISSPPRAMPTTRKVIGNSEGMGGGVSKAKIFKEKYENFQRGGGLKSKTLCGGDVDIF